MTNGTSKQVGNPTGKGGFADHPENRSNGAWKKTDTVRYKLEQMAKMDTQELTSIVEDPTRPVFEQKIAGFILDGDWKTIESMITQVYGQPKQTVDTTFTEIAQPLAPVRKQDLDEVD